MNKVDILLGHWWKLTHGSVTRKIFGAAIIVAILTLVTQLASVAKELTVATPIKFHKAKRDRGFRQKIFQGDRGSCPPWGSNQSKKEAGMGTWM